MTTTEQKWFERVRAWRESGLSAQDFSTGRDFSANTLRQWSSRLRRREAVEARDQPPRIRFARIERERLATAPEVVVVEVAGARVSIPRGTDAATVRAVVAALRGGGGDAR